MSLPENTTKNAAPTPVCMCGQQMTHRVWVEFDLQGGTRTAYGVSCSTDGCPGNFPQVWERIMEKGKIKTDDITESEWRGVRYCIQESYVKPSTEYPMGSYLYKIEGEVRIATGIYEKEFPGHPSPYFHGGPPFVVFDSLDSPWEIDEEINGKAEA
jgi:hypothetical protein